MPDKFIGAISGTSVDGLDLALLECDDERLTIRNATTTPLPSDLAEALIALMQPAPDEIERLGNADTVLGHFIGQAINQFLTTLGLAASDISAIGSHGQTVRHRPDTAAPFTLQIGDPNQIAEVTGIRTVADFRRRDMAAGGQAAPLVPPFHEALFRDNAECRVVLNIGGISNITVLAPGCSPIGFDTGPGNALMDAWIRDQRNEPFDRGASWAATGTVQASLLASLCSDPYLTQPPPKSTGKELYNLAWLTPQLSSEQPADVQRTLAEFTVVSIADAVARWAPDATRLLVCGGGRLNPLLMQGLSEHLTHMSVGVTDDVDVDGDGLEAAAFAWLAYQRLNHRPGNAPTVTGARGERLLGGVYEP